MNTQTEPDERDAVARPMTDNVMDVTEYPAYAGQTVELEDTGPATLRPDQTGDGALRGGTANGGTSGEQAIVGSTSDLSAISTGGSGGDTELAGRTTANTSGLAEITAAGNVAADRSDAVGHDI